MSRSDIKPGVMGVPGGQAPTTNNFYYGTLSASWELDIWGRIRRSSEAARATLLATEDGSAGQGPRPDCAWDAEPEGNDLLLLHVARDVRQAGGGAHSPGPRPRRRSDARSTRARAYTEG